MGNGPRRHLKLRTIPGHFAKELRAKSESCDEKLRKKTKPKKLSEMGWQPRQRRLAAECVQRCAALPSRQAFRGNYATKATICLTRRMTGAACYANWRIDFGALPIRRVAKPLA